MSDDLIKRAREAAEPEDYGEPDTLITELADRIEAQAAEIEKLRDRTQKLLSNIERLIDSRAFQAAEIERLREEVARLEDQAQRYWDIINERAPK